MTELRLRDGTRLLVRSLRSTDGPALEAAVARLSARSAALTRAMATASGSDAAPAAAGGASSATATAARSTRRTSESRRWMRTRAQDANRTPSERLAHAPDPAPAPPLTGGSTAISSSS